MLALALSDDEQAAIEGLCGTLRTAESLARFNLLWSLSEIDIVVNGSDGIRLPPHVSVLSWFADRAGDDRTDFIAWRLASTERELLAPEEFPPHLAPYDEAVDKAVRTYGEDTPHGSTVVIEATTYLPESQPLLLTASGKTVVLRYLRGRPNRDDSEDIAVGLSLPGSDDLGLWFRAFLHDVHLAAPLRVPHAPPHLTNPAEWLTPDERALTIRISQVDTDIQALDAARDSLVEELAIAGENADRTERAVLFRDGDELVTAVTRLLGDLGFEVTDADASVSPGGAKREDLRLRIPGDDQWEAIVEVKGFKNGVRTNGLRQIRLHREAYMLTEGRSPDLTLWVVNPYRHEDPSARTQLDHHVGFEAEMVGVVALSSTALFRLWSDMKEGTITDVMACRMLIDAEPGVWLSPRRKPDYPANGGASPDDPCRPEGEDDHSSQS